MKNIVGKPARGDSFYPRINELKIILRNIEAGNNLQIAAPRRVGKSSILYYYQDNPIEGFSFIYLDVEDIESENEFYKVLYKAVLNSDHLNKITQFIEQLRSTTSNFFKRLKGFSLTGGDIQMIEGEKINYKDELENFIYGLDTKGVKIVIMIDEFPEVILNIIQRNDGDTKEAVSFLQANRSFRNNKDIINKIQFIYTGSNSLNNTVSKFDSTALINDLKSVPVGQLKKGEAEEMLTNILSTYRITISKDVLEYILTKTEWLLPFYLQLIVSELLDISMDGDHIEDTEMVNHAFENIFELRNQHYFEHYISRLKRLFKDKELEMIKQMLQAAAQKPQISFDELVNIATEFDYEKECKKYIEALMYDGYIRQKGNSIYVFNSPILKNWWLKYECN